jgi:CTP synthase (UTP-ammonia lyase)
MSIVSEPLRIGIIGDFNPEFRSHHATNDSLQHSAQKLQIKVESTWLPTPSLLESGAAAKMDHFDGLWASAGSPYKSFDGMLKGIEFARVHDRPFLATCGGFQYTLIECAQETIEEEFFCNYEMNPEFEWMAMEAGFPIVARGSKEECRAIESPAHLFFIATLFQPQLSSASDQPHPLVTAFVQHVADFHRKRLDDSILT